MTRCKQGRHLQAYLDHELPLPQREQLRRHLGECSQCARELEGLQRVERLLAELNPLPAPPQLAAATLHRLRTPAPGPGYVYRHAPGLAAVTAAAACLIFALHIVLPPAVGPQSHTAPVGLSEIIAMPEAMITPAVHPRAVSRAAIVSGSPSPALPRHSRSSAALPMGAKAAVKMAVAAPAAPDLERRAAAAFTAARRHDAENDPDLMAAALENVALSYPGTTPAAQALLAAGDLQRRRGNLTEADVNYRRLLTMRTGTRLSQALAHKALGELRAQSVGEDEVVRYHYQEATRALKTEAASGASSHEALLVMADIARETGNRAEAVADYATVANHTAGDQATASLAEVL